MFPVGDEHVLDATEPGALDAAIRASTVPNSASMDRRAQSMLLQLDPFVAAGGKYDERSLYDAPHRVFEVPETAVFCRVTKANGEVTEEYAVRRVQTVYRKRRRVSPFDTSVPFRKSRRHRERA